MSSIQALQVTGDFSHRNVVSVVQVPAPELRRSVTEAEGAMRPAVERVRAVADDHFAAVERLLGVAIPAGLRAVVREVNGGSPSPQDVPCAVYSGESSVPVYEFARWDRPNNYAALCRTYHDDIGVPRRYLVLATTDADTFFVDLEHPGLRVMYFHYVEGPYEAHFGDGEMDCAGETLDAFMGSFFNGGGGSMRAEAEA